MQTAGDGTLKKADRPLGLWPYDERVACELDKSGDHDCGPYIPPVIQGSRRSDPTAAGQGEGQRRQGQWKVTEYDAIPSDPDTLAAFLATGADVWTSMDIGSTWLTPEGREHRRLDSGATSTAVMPSSSRATAT